MRFLKLLYKKTTWVGLGMIGFGAAQCYGGNIEGGATQILLGLGVITGRHAVQKLEGKKE